MSRYVLTELAIADLEEIAEFVGRRSPEAALRLLRELRGAMRRLAEMPNLGHQRVDLADTTLRFWNLYTYYIVYRPTARPLEVLRVLSVYRDVGEILR